VQNGQALLDHVYVDYRRLFRRLVVTGVMFSIAPAVQISRANVGETLRGRPRVQWRDTGGRLTELADLDWSPSFCWSVRTDDSQLPEHTVLRSRIEMKNF
jgi:hypothetical protein